MKLLAHIFSRSGAEPSFDETSLPVTYEAPDFNAAPLQ